MKDFLTFRTMITPWLIQIIFWLAIIAMIAIAVIDIIQHVSARVVLEIIIIGPLAARIICETFMLFFRMNDTLTQINSKIKPE
jgi:hypothetical protein